MSRRLSRTRLRAGGTPDIHAPLSDDQTPRDLLATSQPIERRNTYELVAESLLALDQRAPPEAGGRAPHRARADAALRRRPLLGSRGLADARVERADHAGAAARSPSRTFRNPLNDSLSLLLAVEEGSLRELFEVRRILEGEAVALATERCDESHLDRMRAATELMRDGLADQDEYIESDVAFHLTIAEATQNRLILHLMHAIRDQLERALGSIYRIPGSPEQSIEDHGLIIAAMAERNPDDARAQMHEHLARVEEAVEAATAKASRAGRSQSNLGFVGLGIMGGGVTRRLLAAGHTVCGYNRSREKAAPLVELGLDLKETPREVAEAADVVFSMVTDTSGRVEAVTQGPDGILAGLGPGKIYVDMTTGTPEASRALAEQVAPAGRTDARRSRLGQRQHPRGGESSRSWSGAARTPSPESSRSCSTSAPRAWTSARTARPC